MKRSSLLGIALLAIVAFVTACETAPKTDSEKSTLERQARNTVSDFKSADPSMKSFFDSSYGYAIFPEIGKGGLVVGGAYGKGVLYQGGSVVGYCDLSQGSIGAQIGGQAYSEVIFFQRKSNIDDFKSGHFALAAQASAVAASAGASADADYEKGVAVFTMAKGGLMAEASVGGQNFTYEAK